MTYHPCETLILETAAITPMTPTRFYGVMSGFAHGLAAKGYGVLNEVIPGQEALFTLNDKGIAAAYSETRKSEHQAKTSAQSICPAQMHALVHNHGLHNANVIAAALLRLKNGTDTSKMSQDAVKIAVEYLDGSRTMERSKLGHTARLWLMSAACAALTAYAVFELAL